MANETPAVRIVLSLDESQCVGCAICADLCPCQALEMGRADLCPRFTLSRCVACCVCAQQCPTGAIMVATTDNP